MEKKNGELDPNVSLGKSKSPQKKEIQKDLNKKFGQFLTTGAGGDLNSTYLLRTVGNPMEEGQYGAGLAPGTENDE